MVLLLLLLLTPVPQGGALETALARSSELDEAGKPGQARAILLAAVQDPEARGEVLAHFGPLMDQLAYLAFQEKNPDPQPGDLLEGDVVKWKARSGQIKVRWKAPPSGTLPSADFLVSEDGDHLFPVVVEDGFKMRIEGNWTGNPTPVSILAGCDEGMEDGWRITGGFHLTESSPTLLMPRRLERFGSSFEMLHQDTKKLEEPDGDWVYSLECRRGKFIFRVGNKRIGTFETRFPDKVPGLLGFRAPGATEIELEAKVDLDDWKRFQKSVLSSRLGRFRTLEYDPTDDLPPWFREMSVQAAAALPMREVPGPLAEAAPDAASEYTQACALGKDLSWKACLEKATHSRGALDFGPLHSLHAEAAYRIGRYEDALKDIGEKMEAWPVDAGRTWAALAGWRFGPRERLKILDRAVADGGVSPDILTTRRRIQLALEGPKGEESSLHQSSSAYVLSTATPEKAAKLGKLVEDQIRHLTKTAAYSVPAREPATVLHFMSEVEADGFLGGMGLEKGTRGYLSELRLLVVVGDPAWSRFRPRVLGPLFPWYMETRYDLRAIPAWVMEGFTTMVAATSFDDSGNAFSPVARAAIKDMVSNPIGLRRPPAELAGLPSSFWGEEADAIDRAEAYLLVHFLWTHESHDVNGFFRNLFTFLSRGLAPETAYNQALGTLDLEALEDEVKLHRRHLIETYL